MKQIQIAITPKFQKQIRRWLKIPHLLYDFDKGEIIDALVYVLPGRTEIEIRIINSNNGPILVPVLVVKGTIIATGKQSKKISNTFRIYYGEDSFEIKIVSYDKIPNNKIRTRTVCEICPIPRDGINKF